MKVKIKFKKLLKKEIHELIELINSFLLFMAIMSLIIYFFNKSFEAVVFYLDIILTFFIILELTIKFFLIESNKEFFKKYWVVILLLLPFAYFSRFFYYLGIVKEEKQSEKLHLLFHEVERFAKTKEITKTALVFRFLKSLLKYPLVYRIFSKLISILLISLLFFENPKKRNGENLKKSAFALDFETLVKFLLLLIFLVVFVLILIKLKNSKFITYLNWF